MPPHQAARTSSWSNRLSPDSTPWSAPSSAAGVKGFTKWAPLFARLTKAGQSVELPRALHGRLSAESHKRNKKAGGAKTWAISSTGPDTCRLWRLL